MSIRKRGDVYDVDITIPGGKRIRHCAGTSDRKAAQEYHDALRAKLWAAVKLGETPAPLWEQAAVRWLKEAEEAGKKSIRNDVKAIQFFTGHWRGLPIDKIDRDAVARSVEAIQCSNSTRNRYVAVIRAILRRAAADWGWLKVAPALKTYREPKRRIRWLTPQEADALIRALPENYSVIARFALATGLRMSNVLKLEWPQIDMSRRMAWIHADQAKAGRAIGVPLNDTAVEVIRSRLGKDQTRVFGHLKRIETRIWKRAVAAAGLTDFRFHDLRHTWASWHVQSGTPLHVLQELGGWECVEMVQRYAHLGTSHLSVWAGNCSKSTLGQEDSGKENALTAIRA